MTPDDGGFGPRTMEATVALSEPGAVWHSLYSNDRVVVLAVYEGRVLYRAWGSPGRHLNRISFVQDFLRAYLYRQDSIVLGPADEEHRLEWLARQERVAPGQIWVAKAHNTVPYKLLSVACEGDRMLCRVVGDDLWVSLAKFDLEARYSYLRESALAPSELEYAERWRREQRLENISKSAEGFLIPKCRIPDLPSLPPDPKLELPPPAEVYPEGGSDLPRALDESLELLPRDLDELRQPLVDARDAVRGALDLMQCGRLKKGYWHPIREAATRVLIMARGHLYRIQPERALRGAQAAAMAACEEVLEGIIPPRPCPSPSPESKGAEVVADNSFWTDPSSWGPSDG